MATNQLLPFGTGGGANVLDFASYSALAARLTGFTAGTALSQQLNTVWRQGAFAAAMIGQFTADYSGNDVIDNGNVAEFETSFVKALRSFLNGSAAAQPVYPEILTGNNAFAYTGAAGSVVLTDTPQLWQHRGLIAYSTASFTLAERTFATVANKTYHHVWDAPGTGLATPAASYPFGRHSLIDRTGATPAETDASYDTTYDRMLCAKVVTNGSNVPTVTPLKNKARLQVSVVFTGGLIDGSSFDAYANYSTSYNWARTPIAYGYSGHVYATAPGASSYVQGGANYIYSDTVDRYGFAASLTTDWNASTSGKVAKLIFNAGA